MSVIAEFEYYKPIALFPTSNIQSNLNINISLTLLQNLHPSYFPTSGENKQILGFQAHHSPYLTKASNSLTAPSFLIPTSIICPVGAIFARDDTVIAL